MRRTTLVAGAVVALAACSTSDRVTGNNFNLTPPSNLTYQLIPSGNADAPEGIDLRWDPVNDPNIADYAVFSRASTADQWSLRARTTSPSFEDLGQPDLQYYVASEAADGSLSAPSNVGLQLLPGVLDSLPRGPESLRHAVGPRGNDRVRGLHRQRSA